MRLCKYEPILYAIEKFIWVDQSYSKNPKSTLLQIILALKPWVSEHVRVRILD